MNYGAFTMLLGGDLTGEVEGAIRSKVGEVDVYKVHHHGSATSSTASFLAKLKPGVSLISIGWDNSFGHPSADTLARLRAIESGVWLPQDKTHPLGHVEVNVTSATGYTVGQGTATVDYTVKAGQ